MYANIVAIDHAVPDTVQTAEELAPLIGKNADWIREQAGVDRRFVSQRMDDPAKLASSIAKPMVEKWGKPDLVIHAGAMPRQLLPDTSVFIMRELGLSGVPGFAINAACLSFLVAMQNATSLIGQGTNKRILICTSEFGSHARNFSEPEARRIDW